MRNSTKYLIRAGCLVLGLWNIPSRAEVWNAFELRYHSNDAAANGETDFRGETEIFDTNQRIEYLNAYEKAAGRFFRNPDWDQLVVSDAEAKRVLATIKPQPLPEVRNRLPLRTWRWLGFKEGIREAETAAIEQWKANPGTRIEDGTLIVGKTSLEHTFDRQTWRFLLRWTVSVEDFRNRTFRVGKAFETGFLSDGSLFYEGRDSRQVVGRYTPDTDYRFEADIDLENGGFNLRINGSMVADFVLTGSSRPVDSLAILSEGGLSIKNLYGEGYTRAVFTEDTSSRDVPYTVTILANEDFVVRPDIKGWTGLGYDDSGWGLCELPHPHGGERFKGESLYLRKTVQTADFTVAELNLETLDPGGEIWINGDIVHVQHDRLPVKVDVSRYLKKNAENLVAIRVFPNRVDITNRHTAMDLYTGWFSGRAWLDFRSASYIKDVFVHASAVSDDKATVKVEALLRNDRIFHVEREMKTDNTFEGFVRILAFPWFPTASEEPVFEETIPVTMRLGRDLLLSREILLEKPSLWTPERPQLYRFTAILTDPDGKAVDDLVVTTGLRQISQEGGTFRLNGKPYTMNGALLFGYKYPLEDIARTLRSGPGFWLIKQLMMVKRLNGNTIRMSIHHGNRGGVNDPRFAEFADQLGVMFQWSTGAWVRSGSPWQLQVAQLPPYIRQVRNHPSIVMWQPGNHPKFLNYADEGREWYEQVYHAIYPHDPSRLISPTANNSRFGDEGAPNDAGTLLKSGRKLEDPGVWNAPMIARGDMEHATGYATDWSTLRQFPQSKNFEDQQGWRRQGFRMDYLKSSDKAWFDFESEESAGHPNQDLRRAKPYSGYRSYEKRYDDETIGRPLSSSEWRASQAWQGFSAFEAYKKKRWLDYDGQIWCTLHGGGNSATYEKPAIDYLGFAKISFHTVRMAFQEVLACSGNVDIVYGPEDAIPVVVMNYGEEKAVMVTVQAKDMSGVVLQEKTYEKVMLPAGRSVRRLEAFRPEFNVEGFVVYEYSVTASP